MYLERPNDGNSPLLYAAPFGLTPSSSASAVNGAGAGGIPAAVSSSSISSLASAGQPSSTPGTRSGSCSGFCMLPYKCPCKAAVACVQHSTGMQTLVEVTGCRKEAVMAL